MAKNPFITSGYEGPEYFCDREQETRNLTNLLENGNNVILISPRRMGKTGLLKHCFQQESIRKNYNTFLIDIYATGDMTELVSVLGRSILSQLMPIGQRAVTKFSRIVTSLRPSMTLDACGLPSWSIDVKPDSNPEFTLQEIFKYLEESSVPNIVAIDEFQQITYYPEKNVEAILRTHIQNSRNTVWVFSGSSRHLLSEMFNSPARPFYASTTAMALDPIPVEKYTEFATLMFEKNNKKIEPEVVKDIFARFNGVTWFIQRVMNRLFSYTSEGEICTAATVDDAIYGIVQENSSIYADLLHQLSLRQKEVLIAICKEGKASSITGGKFIKKYNLPGASSVQSIVKILIDKQILTNDSVGYEVYDKFFALWLLKNL